MPNPHLEKKTPLRSGGVVGSLRGLANRCCPARVPLHDSERSNDAPEPASRVERARILLAYREDPSFFALGRALGLHHQTVQRCVERAVVEGPMAALDDQTSDFTIFRASWIKDRSRRRCSLASAVK